MTTLLPSLCLGCAHRLPDRDSATGTELPQRCAAYPSHIPADIIDGADHRRPRGDEHNGLTYEPMSDTARAAFYFDAWQRFVAA